MLIPFVSSLKKNVAHSEQRFDVQEGEWRARVCVCGIHRDTACAIKSGHMDL